MVRATLEVSTMRVITTSRRAAMLASATSLLLAGCGSDGTPGDGGTGGAAAASGGEPTQNGGASNGARSATTGGTSGAGTGSAPSTASGGAIANGGTTNGPGGAPAGASGGAPAAGGGGTMSGTGGAPGTGGIAAGSGGAVAAPGTPRLFYLDVLGGRVLSANPDGTDVRVLVKGASSLPDGVAVDVPGKHVFWTNMGVPNANDGFVDRTDLDGKGMTTPVAAGQTFTPKQLKLEAASGKLYWADREGMRIMRANIDGTQVETLVETGSGDAARADASNWCVGIALDVAGKKIYWTQKGGDNAGVGSIRRAGIEIPAGQDPAHRTDIEVLFEKLPEPIDLDLDLQKRQIYWTDRGNPPKGNSVSRAPMDPPGPASSRTDQQVLVTGLAEGIGISLDLPHGVMYFGDLGGSVYVANLDGSQKRTILKSQGNVTGIAYVELPP
jgi:hypothetical protein